MTAVITCDHDQTTTISAPGTVTFGAVNLETGETAIIITTPVKPRRLRAVKP